MAHLIEVSKSARAKCRTCKKPIPKDVLRFGEEVPDMFGSAGFTHQWHHMECAAKAKPAELKAAMEAFPGEIPDRAALEATMQEASKQLKGAFPYAERASTGRSKCLHCGEAIEKGDLRVAIEREIDTGTFKTKGAGYLHLGCAAEHTGDEGLFEKIKANSPTLEGKDLEELQAGL